MGVRGTLYGCDVHAELVALGEDALAALRDEVVEALGEGYHAGAEVVEAELEGWEGGG